MDGTLTRPLLDFDRIRADIGITGPILEAISKMSEIDQRRAHEILDRHEIEAAHASTLNDGCLELLHVVREMKIRTALITRNSRANVDIVLNIHRLTFDTIFTRDNAPPKPDPTALLNACIFFNEPIENCWMIGDGFHDIDAAHACGMKSVWIQHDETEVLKNPPWRAVRSLEELTNLLSSLRPM